ncbi:hypothetical protein HAX54_049849, partial [Datura stramonium]|nr:hypothetical protein [Datura stramonium]
TKAVHFLPKLQATRSSSNPVHCLARDWRYARREAPFSYRDGRGNAGQHCHVGIGDRKGVSHGQKLISYFN